MSCVPVASLAPVRSVSTTNLAEKSTVVIPPPDYLECLSMGAATAEKGDISQKASNHNAPALKPESTPPVSRAPICRAGSGVQAPFPLSRKGVTLGQGTHLLPGPVDSVCHAAFQPP